MKPLAFWKMSGAGNDFIVLDGRLPLPRPAGDLARMLCPRGTAVGADGLLVPAPLQEGVIAVDYRNADGSTAAFCGNGARCAARFAIDNGMARPPFTLAFPGLQAEVRGTKGDLEIDLPLPRLTPGAVVFQGAPAGRFPGSMVDAGVPHAIWEEPPRPADLAAFARQVFGARPDLQGRINLTLVRRREGGLLEVRTFERGSGATLACGSAALAAAAWAAHGSAGEAEYTVRPPSGIDLRVRLEPGRGRAALSGPARLVFRGEVPAAFFEEP